MERIFLNKPVKCRYIRYKADNDKYAELAEMTFYANGKAVSPIAVWGSPTEKGNMHVLAKHVADGDPLSYYLSFLYVFYTSSSPRIRRVIIFASCAGCC